MNTASYLTDQPVSIYTQKAAEGTIPTSMAQTGANPFARSTQFTNDIKDTNKFTTDPADKAGRGVVGNGGKLTLLSVMAESKNLCGSAVAPATTAFRRSQDCSR